MNKKTLSSLAIASAILIAGCSDDDDNDSSPKLELRVLHASADAPAVNVQLNGDDAITDLDYAESSGLLTVNPASYDISVDGISPSGTDGLLTDVITANGQSLAANMRYDIVALDKVASIAPVIVAAETSFDTSKARVMVLHAAANVDTEVDVHVTAPSATLSSGTVTTTLDFKAFTETPLLVNAGDYRIRLTLSGELDVVYDSGTLALAAGDDLLISAIENVWNVSGAEGKSPVALSISSDTATSTLFHQNDGFDLRVVHNSADAPAVDVIANDAVTLINALAFPNDDGYVNAAAGTYSVKVAADSDNSVVAINVPSITFNNGDVKTVAAVNKLGDASIEPVVLTDDPRRVATHARVNILHASTVAHNLSSDGVDIYVLPGTDTDITDNTPAIEDFVFKQESGYINLEAGSYNVYVTLNNTTTVATSITGLNLSANTVYLVTARDTDDDFAGASLSAYITNQPAPE